MRLFVNGALDCGSRSCRKCARKLFVVGQGAGGRVRQLRLFDRAFGGMKWICCPMILLISGRPPTRASAGGVLRLLMAFCRARVSTDLSRCRAMRRCALCLFCSAAGQRAHPVISNVHAPCGRRNDAFIPSRLDQVELSDGQDAYTVFANGDLSEEAGMSAVRGARRSELAPARCGRRGAHDFEGPVQPQL